MAYDPGLAERLREALEGTPGLSERRMMGTLVFLRDGAMLCGVAGDSLFLRLDPPEAAAALSEPGVTQFRLGATMAPKSFISLSPDAIEDDAALTHWLSRATPAR